MQTYDRVSQEKCQFMRLPTPGNFNPGVCGQSAHWYFPVLRKVACSWHGLRSRHQSYRISTNRIFVLKVHD
jgi:hypothetical protein